jgi:hypothetical protein
VRLRAIIKETHKPMLVIFRDVAHAAAYNHTPAKATISILIILSPSYL